MIPKAAAFCDEAKKNGWDTKVSTKNGDETHVEAIRSNERITIWWSGNKLVETPFHHYMGQTRSLHNKATATRQLSKKPSQKQVKSRMGKRFTALKIDSRTGEAIIPDGAAIEDLKYDLPFTMEDTDATILKALRGSTIIFINMISGTAESVHIPKQLNMDLSKFNLEDSVDGKTYVNFLGIMGFRSVYLDSILRVM